MSLRVWIPKADDPEFLAALRERVDAGIDLHVREDVPDQSVQVLVAGRPTAEQIAACKELRAVIVPYAGVPQATRDLMRQQPDIAIHNLHHNARPTAELAMALLFAAAKRIVPLDRDLRRGDWSARYHEDQSDLVLLADLRVLVVGYGAIGRCAGQLCCGLGMHVTGIKRTQPSTQNEDDIAVAGADELPQLVSQADVVMLTLPHTPATHGLFDGAMIGRMKRGSILVNVSRGPIVNERALFEALRDGHLRAAGLDVWWNYPADESDRQRTPPSSFPFAGLDNVVLSPHRGGHSDRTEVLRAQHLARLLNVAAAGGPMPDRVDLDHGY